MKLFSGIIYLLGMTVATMFCGFLFIIVTSVLNMWGIVAPILVVYLMLAIMEVGNDNGSSRK